MRSSDVKLTLLWLCLCLFTPGSLSGQQDFVRGDCNNDGVINIADAMAIFSYRFVPGTPAPPCLAACDASGNQTFGGLVDGFHLFSYLFTPGSPPLAAPFPVCGPDPVPSPLPCFSFDCDPPPLSPPSPEYILSLTDASGVVGASTEVAVLLDSAAGEDLYAWSWGVCHDPLVEVLAVADGDALLFGGGGPIFLSVQLHPLEGWSIGLVVNIFGDLYLTPDADQELHVASYSLIDEGVATLEFCDTLGTPPAPVVLVELFGLETITPTTQGATIEVIEATFRRGDANGNGNFNGLEDGVFLLQYQFAGAPAPPCADAADADDDGVLNGLVDAILVLSFQFVPGSPPPPPPGISACGVDPSLDALLCESYPDCF